MATKTREEIEALKASWRKDPLWDIESTQGFEDHKEELLAYRKQVEAEVEQKVRESADRRVELMKKETGITDQAAALYLHTFAEIEIDLHLDEQIGNASTHGELAALEIARAGVRATLLLAAQMKRIADVLEENNGSDGLLVSTIDRLAF